MRKVIIEQELICPFNGCRISIINDEKDIGMTRGCRNCEYVWIRKSNVVSEVESLNEYSKEYKEYELLHTVVCVGKENE